MAITLDEIRARIVRALPGAEVRVNDTTGGGDHFAATVVTSAFDGLGLLERHRLVYAALGDAMRSDIHALALTTETPKEQGKTP